MQGANPEAERSMSIRSLSQRASSLSFHDSASTVLSRIRRDKTANQATSGTTIFRIINYGLELRMVMSKRLLTKLRPLMSLLDVAYYEPVDILVPHYSFHQLRNARIGDNEYYTLLDSVARIHTTKVSNVISSHPFITDSNEVVIQVEFNKELKDIIAHVISHMILMSFPDILLFSLGSFHVSNRKQIMIACQAIMIHSVLILCEPTTSPADPIVRTMATKMDEFTLED